MTIVFIFYCINFVNNVAYSVGNKTNKLYKYVFSSLFSILSCNLSIDLPTKSKSLHYRSAKYYKYLKSSIFSESI